MKKKIISLFVMCMILVSSIGSLVATDIENIDGVDYTTHVQDIGWQNYVKDGELAGTSGQSKRLEGIKIKLRSDISGGVSYNTHVQNIGWTKTVSDDQISGTTGQSLRLEAIKIKLTGEIAEIYDIYYRVHVQNFGWLDWASNGQSAGSQSYGYRLEGIEICLVKKGENAPGFTNQYFKTPGKVYYRTHVQDYGWLENVGDGQTSGTVGKAKRIEAYKIELSNLEYEGSIEYSSHVQNIGWQDYVKDGDVGGTTGRGLRVEALKIKLTGDVANYYDVYYRTHVQNFGWLSWAKNDEKAGSEGCSYRIEAFEVILVKKGENAPSDTQRPFVKKQSVTYSVNVNGKQFLQEVSDGQTTGISLQGQFLTAIKMSLNDKNVNGNIEYATHVANIGWLNYANNGQSSASKDNSNQIEAIKIRLSGEIANYYDVYYRVYCQNIGWLDWAKNDQVSGTTGAGYRVESIQINIHIKDSGAPAYSNKTSLEFKSNNGYLVCYNGAGNLYEDVESLYKINTEYCMRINKLTNVVTVLAKDGAGEYKIAYKRFICSVGNDTPIGTFYTSAKYRWKELMGPSYGQYSTRIVGGILFHSVPYNKMDNHTLSPRMYNQLGTTCSHGCVRLTCADAKWIYDNCPLSSKVVIIEGGSDPLSKPIAQKLPLSQTWDPTDPTV